MLAVLAGDSDVPEIATIYVAVLILVSATVVLCATGVTNIICCIVLFRYILLSHHHV